MLVVRGAAAAWPQDRSCRLGVTVWSAAGDRAPIGELQADLVGLVGEYAAIRGLGVEARVTRVEEGGHGEFESITVCGQAGDGDRGPHGSAQLQGLDGHDSREFRLRRIPEAGAPALQCRATRW
jgi:hypothetical protein